jgi:uncharacterized iron-regulated protein
MSLNESQRRETVLRVATELLAARLSNSSLTWPPKGETRRDAVNAAIDTADELVNAVWDRIPKTQRARDD